MVFVIHDFNDTNKKTKSVTREEAMQIVSEEAYMLFVRLMHAHNCYVVRYDTLKELLAKPDFESRESHEFMDMLEARDQVEQSFKDLISIHPAREVIKSYVAAAQVFAFEQHEERTSHGWTIWQPPYAMETKRIVDAWRTWEAAYVALGYRAVPLADWVDAVDFSNIKKHLPRSIFRLLLIPREASEKPVLHSDKWLSRNPRWMFA